MAKLTSESRNLLKKFEQKANSKFGRSPVVIWIEESGTLTQEDIVKLYTKYRLLPCPLCGGDVEFNYNDSDDGVGSIHCNNCSLTLTDDQNSATETWNNRVPLNVERSKKS